MNSVLPIRPEPAKQPEPVEKSRPVRRAAAALYGMRRRIVTGVAVLLVLFFAWHVVFGRNGVNNYELKRAQNKALNQQIQSLQQENTQLTSHISHLQNDPDEIEFEARQKLHYVRPGEVIYKLNDQPQQSGN